MGGKREATEKQLKALVKARKALARKRAKNKTKEPKKPYYRKEK